MRKKGDKFENKVQKCINSGAFHFDKGDLKTENYLIECKYTEKGSYSINKKVLQKIWNEALESNKLPQVIVGIKDGDYTWILKADLFKERN